MPLDNYGDDDDKDQQMGPKSRYKEFDCPSCNANNPCDPPFGDGSEVLCNYCGSQYVAKVSDEGRVKFREQ